MTWRCRARRIGRRAGGPRQSPAEACGWATPLSVTSPRAAAIAVLVILGGIIVSLVCGSSAGAAHIRRRLPRHRRVWNPVTEKFGAIAPIYGTVVTSFIAMLIAVPVGLFIAMFLTELCPMWLRRPIGIAIELLAGIPSIIYGIWGLFVFAPFLQQYVQPLLIDTLRRNPGALGTCLPARLTASAS